MFQEIVAGLEAGSGYSLLGLAIVVIMKSTDVPNFAMGEMGLVAAYLTWYLWEEPSKGGEGWPFGWAVLVGIIFGALFGALIQYLLIRPLTGLSNVPLAIAGAAFMLWQSITFVENEGLPSFFDWFPVADEGFHIAIAILFGLITTVGVFFALRKWVKPLARVDHFPLLLLTIGLNFVLQAAIELIWGATPRGFRAPWSGDNVLIGDTRVGWDQIITIAAGLVIAFGVGGFFRTKWGTRMRAIAEDGTTARMLGINAGWVSVSAWALGGLIAGIAMTLHTSSTILQLGSAEGLILKGFIAAVLGGFVSLPGTFIGGLVIGVGEAVAGAQIDTSVQPTVALLAVVLVLLIKPGGFTTQAKLREV
ncbi:MAG: branched-chain amino acid ABC transporter permease [Acidimicrobiales bacterium]